MVNSLDIIFESNSSGIYYPNQNVSCKFMKFVVQLKMFCFAVLIELKVDKPIKKAKGEKFQKKVIHSFMLSSSGLRIIVSGIAKSEWNESQASKRRIGIECSREYFFSFQLTVETLRITFQKEATLE